MHLVLYLYATARRACRALPRPELCYDNLFLEYITNTLHEEDLISLDGSCSSTHHRAVKRLELCFECIYRLFFF